jgi:hypothetical protein
MRTVSLRPIDQLAAEWEVTGRSPASGRALRRLADLEEDVAAIGVENLGGLVDCLRRARGTLEREQASQVVRAMLRSAPVDQLVPRAVLQAMVPGLVGVARRLSWGDGGDWEDGAAFFSDVAATAWEVIVDWSGDDRPYAVLDLLSAVRCRLRRQVLRDRASREQAALGLEDGVGAGQTLGGAGTTCGLSDLERLAGAIDDLTGHGLDPIDAAVIYGHRVLGLTMTEIARMSGRPRRQLDARRQRAEHELCA